MKVTQRNYIEEDYDNYIKVLIKENMEQLFIDNFGGWSDEVCKKKFFNIVKQGFVELFFFDNVFAGYVSFNIEKNNTTSFLINDIHLKKEFQQKGIGSQILEFVIKKAKENKISQLKVFVFKNNPSIEFYKKQGFIEVETLLKSDTSIMIKTLN